MSSNPLNNVDLEKGEGRRMLHHKHGTVRRPSSSQDYQSIHNADAKLDGHRNDVRDEKDNQARSQTADRSHAQNMSEPRSTRSVNPDPEEEAAQISVFQSPPVRDPDPAAERLARNEEPLTREDFQILMGLREPESTEHAVYPFKLATKGGLYRNIHGAFEHVQYRYRIFNVATYFLLALQTVIGAIFIVLGALRNPRIYVAISILGAISTAVGGALALMKGQGLPNRLREARNRLRNVVFEAEELYWDFQSGRPIIFSDVKKLREDYLRVMEEMRRNHPDVWTDAATEAMKATRKKR